MNLRRSLRCLLTLSAFVVGARAAVEFPAAVQPQLTATADGRVWLVYGSGKEIFVARSSDAGTTFAAPVRVGSLPALQLGMRRGPRIAVHGEHVVVTAMSGDFFAFHSSDGGATWSAPVRVNDVAAATREGLHDLAVAPDGRLFAVWLDLRAGAMQLAAAESTDHGATWSANQVVYQSPEKAICTCCQPTARFNVRGDLAVMWRNDLAGNRDMWLTVRPAGTAAFVSPAKLGTGSWSLKGCPMDGGSLFTAKDSFATLWQRDGAVFFARPGEPERRLAAGKQPVAVSTDRGTFAVWQQGADLWSSALDAAAAPELLAPAARFASLVALPATGRVLVAYEHGAASVVTSLPPAAAAATDSKTAATPTYPLRGVIVALDVAKSTLRVKHENIPGFMRAMTMQFRIAPAALKSLTVGQAITATLYRDDGEFWLRDIQPAPPVAH